MQMHYASLVIIYSISYEYELMINLEDDASVVVRQNLPCSSLYVVNRKGYPPCSLRSGLRTKWTWDGV